MAFRIGLASHARGERAEHRLDVAKTAHASTRKKARRDDRRRRRASVGIGRKRRAHPLIYRNAKARQGEPGGLADRAVWSGFRRRGESRWPLGLGFTWIGPASLRRLFGWAHCPEPVVPATEVALQ